MSRNARGKEVPDHLGEIAARVNRLVADPKVLETWRALCVQWLATPRATEEERELEAALQDSQDAAYQDHARVAEARVAAAGVKASRNRKEADEAEKLAAAYGKKVLAAYGAEKRGAVYVAHPEQRRHRSVGDLKDLPATATRPEEAAVLAVIHDVAYEGDESAPQLWPREGEAGWNYAAMKVIALPSWSADKAERLAEYLTDVKADLPNGPNPQGGKSDDASEAHPRADQDDTKDDPDTPLSPTKLADRLGIPKSDTKGREALRKRLEAWRKANLDGGWIEARDPKPREPRYLYPLGKVWPLIQDLKPSG